jgi:DNA-binding MarR family transcriptional regulator
MGKGYSIEKITGFIIYRTALAMRAALQRVLKEQKFDITPEQYGILSLLREEEGLSQKEIGNVLFKDKPNISRMLDALERKRLILRQPSDRRRFSIFLTDEGKKLAEEILPLRLQLTEQALSGLLTREIETLENLLNKIYENVS